MDSSSTIEDLKVKEIIESDINESNSKMEEYEDMTLRDAQLLMVKMLKEIDKICVNNNLKYFLDAGTLLGAVRHKGFIPWDDDMDIGMFREDYEKFIKIAQDQLPDNLFLQTHKTDKHYNIYEVPCKLRCNSTLLFEKGVYKNEKMHNGIFIDIFPFDSLPKKNWVYNLQRSLSGLVIKSYVRLERTPEKLSFKNKVTFSIYKIIKGIFTTERREKFFKFLRKWNDKNSEYVGYGLDTGWKEYVYKKSDYGKLARIDFEGEKFYAPENYDAILTRLYGDYMTIPKVEDRLSHNQEIKKLVNKEIKILA